MFFAYSIENPQQKIELIKSLWFCASFENHNKIQKKKNNNNNISNLQKYDVLEWSLLLTDIISEVGYFTNIQEDVYQGNLKKRIIARKLHTGTDIRTRGAYLIFSQHIFT